MPLFLTFFNVQTLCDPSDTSSCLSLLKETIQVGFVQTVNKLVTSCELKNVSEATSLCHILSGYAMILQRKDRARILMPK